MLGGHLPVEFEECETIWSLWEFCDIGGYMSSDCTILEGCPKNNMAATLLS